MSLITNKPLKTLVTGASGFIGQNLVPRLVEMGHEVQTFGRSKTLPPELAKLNLNHHCGDITNYTQVSSAMQGIDLVFHLAGLVSYKKRDLEKIYAINVTGTSNVMQAALKANVKRVIHTSSVAALGIPNPGEIGSEEIKYNLSGLGLTYCDTKYLAELEVQKYVAAGLPAVILNPGIIFGEGDTHSHHYVIFRMLSNGWLIGVPKGGVTFSDINDVIDAHINSITKGKVGERYALVSANLSFRDAALVFAHINGVRGPLFELPGNFLVSLGTIAENILPFFGINPALTKQVAWLSQHKIFFSSAKACSELAFQPTPFEQTVSRTSEYYLGIKKAFC